ncbi:MAG: hypothetical protein K8S25_05640, partial [Alphaproteobacteria bacterium]|nr:hypothetical protein [Alphaproteobacteria bacterium]
MKWLAAALWLVVIVATIAYVWWRVTAGLTLQSNILALLPPTERDASAQEVQDRIAGAFSRRLAFLVSHKDAALARSSALKLATALEQSGMVSAITSKVDPDGMRLMGAAFYPYRMGLLSDSDRERLLANDGKALVSRALSLLYSPGGFANTKLIAHDPFLLLPSYFLALPIAQSRLSAEDGVLSVRDGQETFVLVSADLSGDPYALQFQSDFHDFLAKTIAKLGEQAPGLNVLRTGAVFYAHEGANGAMNETSIIGSISMIATLAMILLVFRGLRPIVLSFAAIGAGMLCAFAGTILIFGEIHTVALLFGASLIGISVDYSLQYFCEYFDPSATDPPSRLQRVLPGVAIGLATTLIGYLTLLLAPFPGLRQVSAFSLIGLSASFLTVVLWYPVLDTHRAPKLGNRFVTFAAQHWTLWEAPRLRVVRLAIIFACVAAGVAGAFRLQVNDDVRNLQT